MELTIGLAFIAGLVSFVSPCVLPLVPAYVGYMGGRMTNAVSAQVAGGGTVATGPSFSDRFNTAIHGLFFVGGFTLFFVALGLVSTAFISVIGGENISLVTDLLGRVGGVVIIFFGLQFMGVLPSIFARIRKSGMLDSVLTSLAIAVVGSLLIWWAFIVPVISLPVLAVFLLWFFLGGAFTNPNAFWSNVLEKIERGLYSDTRKELKGSDKGGYGSSAVMGVVFSAGWTPCIGPVYGAVLTLAANTGDVSSAAPMLAAYSLGLGIPFMLTALLLDSAQGVLRHLQRHMRKIELVSGAFLIIIGVVVASGQLQALSEQFSGEFADVSIRTEECVVGFVQGDLPFNHVGSCVAGTLIPSGIGETHAAALRGPSSEVEFTFSAQAGDTIDFEIKNISGDLTPFITVFDPDGNEIARSDESTFTSVEDVLKPLSNITLPSEGLYIATIANTETLAENAVTNFRLKIAESTGIVTEGTAVDALAEAAVGSIDALAEDSGPPIGLDIGNRAPNFTTVLETGEEISLHDLRGNVVLLNFWATWCGPCRREMPEFQAAYEARADDGFTILAVDFEETIEEVREFQEEFGLTFPLALDETADIHDEYAIITHPSTLMLDRDGVIIFRHFGPLTEQQIQEMIEEALA